MCGICGFYSSKLEKLSILKSMNETMIHRGPDDNGEEIYTCQNKREYCVGLAQRRLSILDLSSMGHQPMQSVDGRVSIVFNGEIYNHLELKKELSDYPYKSNTDTEVLIAAYLQWGIQFVERLNGMFAIAVYDRADDSLYLIRDRIGKKPLYYYRNPNGVYFASELKSLMEHPDFVKEVNTQVVGKFLYRQYINAPETIFHNTYKLKPGEILHVQYGNIEGWKYWDVAAMHKTCNYELSYEDAVKELDRLLRDSIRDRMVADVPVGAFLSGGYDSALICALAQSMSNAPIRTYAIGMYDKALDEAPYAKQTAEYLGTIHTEYYISEKEMFQLVRTLPEYYDEPFADSSQICTMLVSELAKKDVTVVLTGDGGDEMFGGYTIYEKLALAEQKKYYGYLLHFLYKLPMVNRIREFKTLPLVDRLASESLNPNTRVQTGAGQYLKALDKILIEKNYLDFLDPIEKRYQEPNWAYRRMLLDMDTYLPGDILCKVDRASMKYSLEARCPFLDKEIMEFSLGLPVDYKIRNGNLKSIIKDLTYQYIPREIMNRPKQGFSVPMDKWLRNELKEELMSYIEIGYLNEQGIFDPIEVRKLVSSYLETGNGGDNTGNNYGKFIWAYFIFQQWYKYYMK